MISSFFSKPLPWLLIGLGLLLTLVACAPPELPAGSIPEGTTPTEPIPSPIHTTLPPPSIPEKTMTPVQKRTNPLSQSSWQLENYFLHGESKQALSEHPATIEFQDGKFSGNTGCNGFSGTYAVEGDAIHFQLGPMTLRACQEDVADQEAAFLSGLESAAAYQIQDGKLMLLDKQGKLLLIFMQQQPISLTDGSWQLLFFNNGKGGMESNLATERITAQFSEDGRVSGNAGCNHYFASYQVDGDKLTLGVIGSTEMFCQEPEGVMETESAFLKNLSNVAAFNIEGDRLVLLDQEGKKLLIFRHVPEPTLTSHPWQLAAVGKNEETPVSSITQQVRILFTEAGRVSGNAGCNDFKGNYRVEDNRIQIGPLATTRKMCKKSVMDVERDVLRGLEEAVTFHISSGQLVLQDESGAPVLIFIPAP